MLGEELNQEQESLEVDMTRLQQKGIEMSSSNLGMIITGKGLRPLALCKEVTNDNDTCDFCAY